MQVSVESTGGLERRITVQVPAEQVDQEVDNRLRSISREVRLHGFRPGKVPFKVVKQRFGRQVRAEVADELMRSTFVEAVEQEKLRPAGGPELEVKTLEPGKDLEYSATFEVLPEIEPAPVEEQVIEKPVVEITDADVGAMVERLRKQRMSWSPVERGAAEGDQLVVDFEGTIDGEPFEGNKAEDFTLVLGSGQMIEGFEEPLEGATAGETREVEVTFPDDYHAKQLAGKKALFKVTVKSVSEPVLPEVDEELARSFGVQEGGVEGFYKSVRENLQRELDQRVRARLKEQVIDALLELNPVELPKVLVEQEIDQLIRNANEQRPASLGNVNLPRELFEEKARRQVALGLLFGEIVRRDGIKVDDERIEKTLDDLVADYDDPDALKQHYRSNPSIMQQLESLALEEQVIDHLLGKMKVEEKTMAFGELMNPEGADEAA